LGVVVGDNGVWEVVTTNEVLLGEFFHLVGRNVLKWSCFYPLGEVVDVD